MPKSSRGGRGHSTSGANVGPIPGPAPGAVLQALEGMRAIGIDIDELCVAAGLPRASLAERVTHLHFSELAPVWRGAAERFGRATIGLHVGAAHPAGHIIDYLALASPTVRAALLQITRYYGLIGRHAKWVVRPLPGTGTTLLEHVEKIGPGTVADQIREFSIAIAAVKARAWSGRPPAEVWFHHAPFGPAEEYRRVLGCTARFERDLSGVLFDDAALDEPKAGSDPQLAGFLQAHADVLLADVPDDATFAQQVRGAVVEELRDGEPDITKVARRLATSARSLQRRLQAEGSSFRGVVDATRHELADAYLGEKNLSIADVTYLLGYSEPGAFIRAFKRWTGRTPRAAERDGRQSVSG